MATTTKKKTAKTTTKKKIKRSVFSGRVYIQSTFNNTIVSVTDDEGNVLAWSTAGSLGFKGTKKSTPYAAQMTCGNAMEKSRSFGLKKVQVFVSGVGAGRESAVRSLSNSGLDIELVKDVTPMPHNGCRPKKSRRI
ncbi:MAG: 30S ribosomal protein S11 [bacterium ADurb.Bin212]|nr:MAG: 30S ribosomal protein S11 [bacterium ADurb.Bin212]